MDDLPSIYPFCVSQISHGDSMGSVIFEDKVNIKVIIDGTDNKAGNVILTKGVYEFSAPRYICHSKCIANDNEAIGWEITQNGGQFNHLFTRHDTRPGYVDGKSMTTLPADVVGRDLEAAYSVLLQALPKLKTRSTSEAERIMTGLKATLTTLQLTHLL